MARAPDPGLNGPRQFTTTNRDGLERPVFGDIRLRSRMLSFYDDVAALHC